MEKFSIQRAENLMTELCLWYEKNQQTAPQGVIDLVEDEIARLSTTITIRKKLGSRMVVLS